VIEAEKQCLVQEFVPHLRIKGFTDAVLHGLAGSDEVPGDARLFAPGQHGVRGELRAMITDDQVGLAAPGDDQAQFSGYPATRNRRVDDRGQAFLGQ